MCLSISEAAIQKYFESYVILGKTCGIYTIMQLYYNTIIL